MIIDVPEDLHQELKKAVGGWLKHIEHQKWKAETLQKAAALARKGDKMGAMKLKGTVDRAPRVHDAGALLPALTKLMGLL